MKLHLSVNKLELAGYTNIDVTKQPIDLGKLDNICSTSECTDIIVDDLLRFIPYEALPGVAQHLISKLRHKGRITIIFTDFNSIIREFNTGNIDEKTLNQLLFLNGSRSCFSSEYLTNALKATQINIVSVSVGKKTIIIAERP